MLNEKEKYRYDRQIKLDSLGISGQEKLKASNVLVIGAGGLGCPVLQYLTAAGVGKIGIVDFDSINESNLHRQILFSEKDLGNNKAFAAAERLKGMNSFISIEAYPKRLDNSLALELFPNYDLIVDATDNFTSRYLINDACVLLNKPFVYGSIFKTEGQVSVFNYKNGSTYRCLFPQPPQFVPSCEEVGVMGVLCGIIGAKQANEVIKMIIENGEVLSGKLEMYDALRSTTNTFSYSRNENLVSRNLMTPDQFLKYDYAHYCGEQETKYIIESEQLNDLMQKNNVQIFDIRQDWEEPKLDYKNIISIPLQDIEKAVEILSRDQKIVLVCQYGTRSSVAVEYLRLKHQFRDVAHLKGGLQNFIPKK
ncbi:MAG: HesA/MoeB/ThiF family protein [Crocinitomicaceae bacterium]|nr:HesA/MoeB/ThiF family protein [Crocinitomicaceae bacterium]